MNADHELSGPVAASGDVAGARRWVGVHGGVVGLVRGGGGAEEPAEFFCCERLDPCSFGTDGGEKQRVGERDEGVQEVFCWIPRQEKEVD